MAMPSQIQKTASQEKAKNILRKLDLQKENHLYRKCFFSFPNNLEFVLNLSQEQSVEDFRYRISFIRSRGF